MPDEIIKNLEESSYDILYKLICLTYKNCRIFTKTTVVLTKKGGFNRCEKYCILALKTQVLKILTKIPVEQRKCRDVSNIKPI